MREKLYFTSMFTVESFEDLISQIKNPKILISNRTLIKILNTVTKDHRDDLVSLLLASVLIGRNPDIEIFKEISRFDFVNKNYNFHGVEIPIEIDDSLYDSYLLSEIIKIVNMEDEDDYGEYVIC